MRTEYAFSVDTAELVYSRKCEGNHVYIINRSYEFGVRALCSVFVSEGFTAEREFFAHFGGAGSPRWPTGWYAKMTDGKFTRLSWQKENYPESKVSWQEYFGVPCRDDIGDMLKEHRGDGT
jgi:hypothetical protein